MHYPSPRAVAWRLSLAAALCAAILAGAVLTWYKGHRPAPIAAAAPPRKPDVVYILTDDQFYQTLWSMPKLRAQLVQRACGSPTCSRRTRCARHLAPAS